MAVYFIRSQTREGKKLADQSGSVETNVIKSNEDYSKLVDDWIQQVATEFKCPEDSIQIMSIARLD